MAFQPNASDALPEPSINPPTLTTSQLGLGMTASAVIQELMESDRASQEYCQHLELRLREQQEHVVNERHRYSQLELTVSNLKWSRSQLETALDRANSNVQTLKKELEDMQKKSDALESRHTALMSLSDSLLKLLLNTPREMILSDGSVDISQVCSELLRQRETIRGLETSNRYHAETLMCLKATLEATWYENAHCSPVYGSDDATVFENTSGSEMSAGAVAPEAGQEQRGTWYNE